MHFSTLIPLILSLGQYVVANPISINIAIDEDGQGQPPPTISALDGTDLPSFRIRAVPANGPRIPSNLFLGLNPSIHPPGQLSLSFRPVSFALSSGALHLQASEIPGTVQPVGDGRLVVIPGPINTVSWTITREPMVGDILVPIIYGQAQKNALLVDGYGPDARVFVCGPHYGSSCQNKPAIYFRIEPFSNDDSLTLESSPSNSLTRSITEDHHPFQGSISHEQPDLDSLTLEYPFNLRAIKASGQSTELFVDELPIAVPHQVALRRTGGLFFLQDGNLAFGSPKGETVQSDPYLQNGYFLLKPRRERSPFRWAAVEHGELGRVLVLALGGKLPVSDKHLLNSPGPHENSPLFPCGGRFGFLPCGYKNFYEPIYLRVERVETDSSLDIAHPRPGHSEELLQDL